MQSVASIDGQIMRSWRLTRYRQSLRRAYVEGWLKRPHQPDRYCTRPTW